MKNKKSKFQIGDKVKVIGDRNFSKTPIGTIGTVHVISHSGGIIVKFEDGTILSNCPWVHSLDLEHYQEDIVLDVVLKPEFVLPRDWCVRLTKENFQTLDNWRFSPGYLSKIDIIGFIHSHHSSRKGWYSKTRLADFTEITFEQFKQYVLKEKSIIEPFPFFKVLIGDALPNSIYRVQNNEGNVFQVGDKIRSITGRIAEPETMIIKSFRYNEDKTNICAITTRLEPNGIGIDKIEHVLEFKDDKIVLDNIDEVLINKESLLDKAKRLYPIGTRFKCLYNMESEIYEVIELPRIYNIRSKTIAVICRGLTSNIQSNKSLHHINRGWAEIISKPKVNQESSLSNMLKQSDKIHNEKYDKLFECYKEETLLEKAKRLYPIGTRFLNAICGLKTDVHREGIVISYENKPNFANSLHSGNDWIVYQNNWAKILYNGYKVNDEIMLNPYGGWKSKVKITELKTIDKQEVAFFEYVDEQRRAETSHLSKEHNRILIKNIKK